ncbi:nucleotide sugar dehydrogenase [Paenibacillus sp. J5C_2022]|uniref:nucleotide sugar dehydrogenase n=1 Tax=Paenibacillus sp. J5C2022 TaxID=2977129 RepID=UPI0021D3D74C|nr:nucleotide sugar dehydrogenase [Paenibacillus sp. J5C2022]MCU6710420.1 nucleotide sugar dehydrogenase [Paenibacillus sp. J5C2022]
MDIEQAIRDSEDQRTVAILGLGYVGLPLALLFVKSGFRVLGIDPDTGKIDKLHKGISYIHEIEDETVKEAMSSHRFLPTAQYSAIEAAEAVIICVPTPLTPYGTPDLSYLTGAIAMLVPEMKRGLLIVLESSTYPGTTREVLLPMMSKRGLKAGSDYYAAYSPERVDPGNKQYPLEKIPKIVSGVTERCLKKVSELYGSVFPSIHPVSSTDAAEMAKILENTYRLVNISFINEMAMLCDRLDLDIWEVIEAAGTKPFGFQKFSPGPGIGGHCIPVDPSYLLWKVKQHEMNSEFIQLSNAVNHRMPHYIVQQLKQALSPKTYLSANIMVYGVAYKKDIADCRESAAIDLIELLRLEGANVYYHDPFVPDITVSSTTLRSIELTEAHVREMDAVVIATDHSNIPLELLMEHAVLLYDTRNVTKGMAARTGLIRLGAGRT